MKNRKTLWHYVSYLMAFFAFAFFGCMLNGCSSKTVVVLLPETDGSVGEITVTTQDSSAVLQKPYESVLVGALGEHAIKGKNVDSEYVHKIFGDALNIQPLPPVLFLLYFKSGGTELTDSSKALIPDIMESIRDRHSVDISVVGHTDRVGSAKKNWELSRYRASHAAKVLSASGVNIALIEITSHGESNPVIVTEDGVAEPKNRRVEVVIR